MKARKIAVLLSILAVLAIASGCSLLGGFARGGTGFAITADPPGGHPPFSVTLTATPYQQDGHIYGTYVWETPQGSYSIAGNNVFSIYVTDRDWEITGYWVNGNEESSKATVSIGLQNSPPAIFEPLNNGRHDRFLRPGPSEHILWWPVNKVLDSYAIDRRGIYDAEGDDVTVLDIQIRCSSKGVNDTIFMPPFTKLATGQMRYQVNTQGGQYKNAVLFYPGFTSPRFDEAGRPYGMGPLDGSYGWDPCHTFGLGCGSLGCCVYIYILVEDEWGSRNSAVFLWPMEDMTMCNGLTVGNGPFPTNVNYDLYNDAPDSWGNGSGSGAVWGHDDDIDLIEPY